MNSSEDSVVNSLLNDSSRHGFCDDPLWDSDLTWNTESPDFTTCFHQTVLVYVPALILVAFSPIEAYRIHRSIERAIPWTFLNVSRLVLNAVLIILPIIDLGYAVEVGAAPVHAVAPVVRVVCYVITLLFSLACQRRGCVTSGLLWVFWLFSSLFGALTFASVLSTPYISGDDVILPFVTYLVQYPLVLVLFFLSFWADAEPKYKNLDGNEIFFFKHK